MPEQTSRELRDFARRVVTAAGKERTRETRGYSERPEDEGDPLESVMHRTDEAIRDYRLPGPVREATGREGITLTPEEQNALGARMAVAKGNINLAALRALRRAGEAIDEREALAEETVGNLPLRPSRAIWWLWDKTEDAARPYRPESLPEREIAELDERKRPLIYSR